jgi:hypothetical protein
MKRAYLPCHASGGNRGDFEQNHILIVTAQGNYGSAGDAQSANLLQAKKKAGNPISWLKLPWD